MTYIYYWMGNAETASDYIQLIATHSNWLRKLIFMCILRFFTTLLPCNMRLRTIRSYSFQFECVWIKCKNNTVDQIRGASELTKFKCLISFDSIYGILLCSIQIRISKGSSNASIFKIKLCICQSQSTFGKLCAIYEDMWQPDK